MGVGDVGDAGFAQELAALKRRGSNLLVVGSVRSGDRLDACGRLLGEDGGDGRRRLVVATDADPALDRRLPSGADPGEVRVVDVRARTRSAATAGGCASTTADAVENDLDALWAAVGDAIEAHADAGLEPAELRVCVDSLLPLLARHERVAVGRFLGRLTAAVVAHRGMGHVHLPLARDHEHVRALEPLFDGVVELASGNPPRQRWHLRRSDLTTGWLPLEPHP